MKLDFLKTLQQLQPMGLRGLIDPLSDAYPAMAHSEWKEVLIDLIDSGYVLKQSNGQYKLSPAGEEAITKGREFLDGDEALTETDSSLGSYKPPEDHPWRKPLFTKKQESGEVPLSPNQASKGTTEPSSELHHIELSDDNTLVLDELADSISISIQQPVIKLSTDELLAECRTAKEIITSLEHRRELAVIEIERRLEGL